MTGTIKNVMARSPAQGAVPCVALAAGGTGGHMFPAQALAEELLARGCSVVLITDRRGGGFGDALPAVATHRISAGGIAGTSLAVRVRNVIRLGFGGLQARRLLKNLEIDTVVGFGGYPSVPTVLAAGQLGLRVVLHEQNAVLGRANRLLTGKAECIATSFRHIEKLQERDRGKIVVTGNPVRPAVAAIGLRSYGEPAGDGELRLLVTGGSQGARVFNEVVPDAVRHLPEQLRARLQITQQVPGDELTNVAAAYDACGVRHSLAAFFSDLPERLAKAHLVICRSGASTVAELAAAGRPAILVPFPFATDDHQSANARALAEAGGGWLMPQDRLTGESLAERLTSLLSAPGILAQAAHAARGFAEERAAARLADLVYNSNGDRIGGMVQRAPGKREAAA